MSKTTRKPRPLNRDVQTFRDDRLIIAACDDTYAPKQYFDFFEIPRVQIHVITTQDGTSHAKYVLNRLLEYEHNEYDELWMILDTDHHNVYNHMPSFIKAIHDAKANNVKIAISRPCFELWLLLHHEDIQPLSDAVETTEKLRGALGEYNKKNLKEEHYPIPSVIEAYKRAKAIDSKIKSGDIPDNNTTRVYLLWEAIISKAPESQLSQDLNALKIAISAQ